MSLLLQEKPNPRKGKDTPLDLWAEGATERVEISALSWGKGVACGDEQGLPAVVQHHKTAMVLMMAYMTPQALEQTLRTGLATFYSRSRGKLWCKGETSGHWLRVISVAVDCDRDTILVQADPAGPACHRQWPGCFHQSVPGALAGWLAELEALIADRDSDSPGYTGSLRRAGVARMAQKVGEEGVETALALALDADNLGDEAADLLYHLLVALSERGYSMSDIVAILKKRHEVSVLAGSDAGA